MDKNAIRIRAFNNMDSKRRKGGVMTPPKPKAKVAPKVAPKETNTEK